MDIENWVILFPPVMYLLCMEEGDFEILFIISKFVTYIQNVLKISSHFSNGDGKKSGRNGGAIDPIICKGPPYKTNEKKNIF